MTHKYVKHGWTVTLPAPGTRFVGHADNLMGRFFGTFREAHQYRRECLGKMRVNRLMKGEYRVVRASVTFTATEPR